jgi:cobalt-zinc-cadmium efflux system outer membrane protein
MRRLPILAILFAFLGCHPHAIDVPAQVEAQVTAVAPVRVVPDCCPAPPALPALPALDLAVAWDLALVHNPSLREAAADVEAARGRLIQAGLYPNPRILFDEDTIGSSIARQGNTLLQVNQEIITAGKRRLDRAVAARELDAATLALLGRKFEVLTRVRRAYSDYVGWVYTVRAGEEVVGVLEQGAQAARRLVEEVKTRPRTDLLRTEALLEEARISLARSRANRDAAWRQLTAEIGLPELPPPETLRDPLDALPQWDAAAVTQRVLAAHTALKQAGVEVERNRLALERARAQVAPNVTVGGGFTQDRVDQTAGGTVSVETALPLWDRNQGNIRTAEANLVRAQAALSSTTLRLRRETAAAFADYEAGRQQLERLAAQVLPRLEQSLEAVRKGYQAGAAEFSFLDVLSAEQALFTARLTLAEARRNLWLAVAELQGLMQLDLGEEP